MFVPLPWMLALAQGVSTPPQTPAPQPPPASSAPAPADPARLTFPEGASGLVLVAVKPDLTADYEAVLAALKAGLAAAGPEDRRLADGWQVFKAREADAKGNAVYVHWLPTPLADTDYRPSIVLDRIAQSLPEALFAKYRAAIAAGPNRLSLDSVIDLGLRPVPIVPKR